MMEGVMICVKIHPMEAGPAQGRYADRILWFLVLGVTLTFFPGLSANVLCYIGGGLLMVYGI